MVQIQKLSVVSFITFKNQSTCVFLHPYINEETIKEIIDLKFVKKDKMLLEVILYILVHFRVYFMPLKISICQFTCLNIIKIKNKMSNFKEINVENDLVSTICNGFDLPSFQEVKCQFMMPISNDDPFNLFESHQKQEDISIYLSLNREKDQDMRFLMDENEQIFDSSSFVKTKEDQKKNIERNSECFTQNKVPTQGETKNIPKNFGKQLIKFVNKNKDEIENILQKIGSQVKYAQFNFQLQKKKKKMNKISDLRQLWLQQTRFGRQMRIISSTFLRKYAFKWIFNSKVANYQCHLKYRSILFNVIKKPSKFVFLKTDY